jgi:hypothetical protein
MLKKIDTAQVRLGMHIHELCGPWMQHPFWRTKFFTTDPEDLRSSTSDAQNRAKSWKCWISN